MDDLDDVVVAERLQVLDLLVDLLQARAASDFGQREHLDGHLPLREAVFGQLDGALRAQSCVT